MSNTFLDSKGDSWNVNLNVGMIEDLKAHDIDLNLLFKDANKFSDLFLANPAKLGEMFHLICEDQINERGLSPRDFAKRLDRETLDRATDALIYGALLFSQRKAVGIAFRDKLPQMMKEMDERLTKEVETKLESTMKPTSSNLHTNSPVSSGFVPEG